jgi:dephospho-CoA kinase
MPVHLVKQGVLYKQGMRFNYMLVFGIALTDADGNARARYIGINLDTSKPDSFPIHTSSSATLRELGDKQLSVLAKTIPAYLDIYMHTLAITAKPRSGKDTMANFLHETMLDKVALVSLGAPIYQARDIVFGKPTEEEGKDRQGLIDLAQTMRNHYDADVWIKSWLSRAVYAHSFGKTSFIVADVRQPNEFEFFRSLGATMVKIEAAEDIRQSKMKHDDKVDQEYVEQNNKDETEKFYDSFSTDVVIKNNYDEHFLEDVRDNVVGILIDRGWKRWG